MLSRLLIFLICFLSLGSARSQSDIKVMLKQIALLAVHVRELENAIEIARDGLTTIHEIKNGEFNLHNIFFSSLKSINPAVAKYSRIAVIIAEQVSIVREFETLLEKLQSSKGITSSELRYITSAYSHIADECTKSLNALIEVTTSGRLEMTDDERIKRIDVIASDMNDKYEFSRNFTAGTYKLLSERNTANEEVHLLKSLE